MNQIVFSDGKIFDTAEYPVDLEPPILAKKILEGSILPGETITVDVQNGDLVIR